MNISTKAIGSSFEMIKNYKDCREKAKSLGKMFIAINKEVFSVILRDLLDLASKKKRNK